MKVYSYPTLSEIDTCPYLEKEKVRFRYFFADDLSQEEWATLLQQGFRKFGHYIFRPECPQCQKCIPLRVRTKDYTPSKSQRRVRNKNKDTHMSYHPLQYRREIYDLYKKHSEEKFDISRFPIVSEEEFIRSHFTRSSPSLMTEYRREDQLVAVGFIDVAKDALSSVYFIYDPDFSQYNLGTLGAITEIELAREMEKSYYYLGYYIKENSSMSYKANFRPYEILTSTGWEEKGSP